MLFLCDTGKDTIDAYDEDTFRKFGRVDFNELHDGVIGPRAGVGFNGKLVIAGCYDNTLSVIDANKLKEIKTVDVGAYPISVVSDGKSIFTACGDSNSIWTIDDNFDVTFVDTTVKFPFCMAVSNDELCVCGFMEGEVLIYEKNNFDIKEYFKVQGYPYGTAYINKEFLISYNSENEGLLYYGGKTIKIGDRVGKIVAVKDKVYICVNDNKIVIINLDFSIFNEIYLEEPIGDFAVSDKGIFVSQLLGGDIIKFSLTGEEVGRISVNRFGSAIVLS